MAFANSAAKIRAGKAAGKVAEIAHQVHGAIGFTTSTALRRTVYCGDSLLDRSPPSLNMSRSNTTACPNPADYHCNPAL
jgi:hypothetical protein